MTEHQKFRAICRKNGMTHAAISELLRRAKLSRELAERACNYGLSDREDSRDTANDLAIRKIARSYGIEVFLGGDPRGYTVRLHFPTGEWNTWGGKEHGYGVPGS